MTFRPNPSFAREVARESQMRTFLDEVIDDAVSEVRSGAPVGATGDLAGSVSGEVKLTADGYVGEVTVDDWKWHFAEYGTSHHRAQPFLRPGVLKALSRRGGRLEEGR